MADSSTGGGFFAYYRQYARSGVHAASAAALTALGLWASFTGNRLFILLAIAVYVLPPVLLYLTGEGENVPSVVGDDTSNGDERESSERGTESDRRDAGESSTDRETGQRTGVGSAGTDTEPDSTITSSESPTRSTDTADEGPAPTASSAGTADESDSATHESVVEEISDGRDPAESSVDDSGAGDSETEPGWTEADVPTDESLLDVVATRDGTYAVGKNGVVLARDGEEWSVALEQGPTANSNSLRGVDATADGKAVWFAGDSGVLGCYADGRLTDHSAPEDQTSTWTDVAVTGDAGDERIHLVNGSGELLRGSYENGAVEWGEIEKPGSGSSISSIEFVDGDRGHICDTNQSVYETTDGGESYETIGIEDANAAFTGVAATDSSVVVAGDDGSVFRYDGAVWTPLQVGDTLSAIDRTEETGLAAGDGGRVYELTEESWEAVETPVDNDLAGIAIGTADSGLARPAIAVGTDGTVIERHR